MVVEMTNLLLIIASGTQGAINEVLGAQSWISLLKFQVASLSQAPITAGTDKVVHNPPFFL